MAIPQTAQNPQLQTQTQNDFWHFVKNAATEKAPECIELWIEGDIVDNEDVWLYEWFGMPSAAPNAFKTELAQYSGKDITLWIDSPGGNVFAAAGIYTALMQHKQCGAKITVKAVNAMSAATIPMMTGDERLMSPMGIYMMHNPLTSASGYASDLRQAAAMLDTVKEAIINAYQMATGISPEKISSMMDDTTFMSAKVAVKEGFATGILYDTNAEVKNEALNFSYNYRAVQNSMSASMNKLTEIAQLAEKTQNLPGAAAASPQTKPEDNKHSKEDITEMDIIKNAEELKTQLPEIHNAVFNAGVAAERARLVAFDALNGKIDQEFLAKAKAEDGATAESVLFKAMQDGKIINSAYVANAAADAANANEVAGAASDGTKPDELTGVLNRAKKIAENALGKGGK